MSQNQFFKPTVLYKEYMILDMIEKNSKITQREISQQVGISVSIVNDYIDQYENQGLIIRKKHSTKNVEYFVTKKGSEKRKLLNISYLNASLKVFKSAKSNIIDFLDYIIQKGYKKILLYGAGEVAEILLQTIVIEKEIPIKILGIIDDDQSKQNHSILRTEIMSLDNALELEHDGILISSYTNNDIILRKLTLANYDINKIIQFFS